MSRTKEIDFRRVTFSFPAIVVDKLRIKIGKSKMSSYVADLVEEDLSKKKIIEESDETFLESLKQFAIENSKHVKTKKSSLKILREIRYGGKY